MLTSLIEMADKSLSAIVRMAVAGDVMRPPIFALNVRLTASSNSSTLSSTIGIAKVRGSDLTGVIEGHVTEIESLCARATERAQAQMGTVRQRFEG